MDLIQREDYNKKPMEIMGISRYPNIPDAEEFLNSLVYEKPKIIHGWQWSTTFGRWSALVTFSDGWYGFSYPKRTPATKSKERNHERECPQG